MSLSLIQRFNVLFDRSHVEIRCDNLQVTAANPFKPQFADFGYRLAAHIATEVGKETALTSDNQGPKAIFGGTHILSLKNRRSVFER